MINLEPGSAIAYRDQLANPTKLSAGISVNKTSRNLVVVSSAIFTLSQPVG
jgi:hypothetical protein